MNLEKQTKRQTIRMLKRIIRGLEKNSVKVTGASMTFGYDKFVNQTNVVRAIPDGSYTMTIEAVDLVQQAKAQKKIAKYLSSKGFGTIEDL